MARSGTRRRYQDDEISDEEIEGKRTFGLDDKVQSDRYGSELIRKMDGKDFTVEYIQREGLRDPVVFEKPDGLGIKMPNPDFSVNDVKLFVGSRRMIDVMDVSTQKGIEMSMAQWRRYYETPSAQREKLYNVISLEFSHTRLESLVKRPASVDVIDWVDNMWPRHLKERQRETTNAIVDMQYPKVQKYCLMSVQGCYTDFHIDFGGTSVWYHILRGSKVFWLIPPTPQNLELYENWVLSGKQGDVFLGDRAMDCQRVELKPGYTFFIPSGWIHAVYTPVDTLVFGGNFLHSFNIPMQLRICSIEERTRVPTKFRFPFFAEMCWYVLERYLYSLTGTSHLTPDFQKHSLGVGLKREEAGSSQVEEEDEDAEVVPGRLLHLTPFELEGLWCLLEKLESLPSHKKCVPPGIHNAPALLHGTQRLLQEHANDDPQLSYTGKPIVRWPKRPSWYQPPLPPPPPVTLGRPRLSNTASAPRPTKPTSSMSVLRRRRVRCKRCEACLRPECGDCNFCRDMKKFGGPGKLKQTCVLRQCLAPGLPLSAVCEVCGEGSQEHGDELTLMECSSCAQITHPRCLQVPGEGVINKDLPSCWECPKCTTGKESESESSGSEDSALSAGSLSPSTLSAEKRSYRKSVLGVGDDGSGMRGRGRRTGRPPLSSVATPANRLILQHSRKRAAAMQLHLRKRHKPSVDSHQPEDDEDDEESISDDSMSHNLSSHSRGSSASHMRAGRRGLWRGPAHSTLSSASGLRVKRVPLGRDGRRQRGRRAYPRGAGRPPRRRDDSEDEDSESEEDEDEEDEEEEESDDGELENEATHQDELEDDSEDRELDGGEEPEDDEGDEEENQSDWEPDPPVLLVSDLNDDLLSGSYLTVTLQRPTKAKRDPGAIVPKLEAAVSPRTPPSAPPGYIQRKTLQRARHRNGVPQPRPQGRPPRHLDSPSGSSSRSSASPPAPPATGSPPSLLSLPSFKDVGNEPGAEKEVWVSVFRYLSRAELYVCMSVCKSWYKWSCDKRLWSWMDVSRRHSLSQQALSSISKRQPLTLDLSWTTVSKKQLTWLIRHLPGLKDLRVCGCSWLSISALSSSLCPLLHTLDLRWADGVKDSQMRDMITPPGCETRSKLRNVRCLRLAGLDISDSTLRLIVRHMSLLTRLDLSHCQAVSDASVSLLTATGSSTRNTLTQVYLAGCHRLSDTCLLHMRRVSTLTLLDLRGCKGVSHQACEAFISDLCASVLFCLTEDRLIQRLCV